MKLTKTELQDILSVHKVGCITLKGDNLIYETKTARAVLSIPKRQSSTNTLTLLHGDYYYIEINHITKSASLIISSKLKDKTPKD